MTNLTARPTTYKGIKMRSRLEAAVAAHLDGIEVAWEYEPQCFASPDGQYLPDFRITTKGGSKWYVEIKGPPVVTEEQRDEFLARMEIIWASEPDARLFFLDSTAQWWFGCNWAWVPFTVWEEGQVNIDALIPVLACAIAGGKMGDWQKDAVGRKITCEPTDDGRMFTLHGIHGRLGPY